MTIKPKFMVPLNEEATFRALENGGKVKIKIKSSDNRNAVRRGEFIVGTFNFQEQIRMLLEIASDPFPIAGYSFAFYVRKAKRTQRQSESAFQGVS